MKDNFHFMLLLNFMKPVFCFIDFPGVPKPATCCVNNVALRGRADILPWPVADAGRGVSLRRAAVLLLQRLQKAVGSATK